MEFTSCPWDSLTFYPAHFCETNLCSWVVQPANTWSNISYLIAAYFIFKNKHWKIERRWFAFIVFCLFIGSTLFHMTSTLIGRDMDVGAMLLLSSYSLSLTLSRSYKWSRDIAVLLGFGIFFVSLPSLHAEVGGIAFLIQFLITAILEFMYSKREPPPTHIKRSLVVSLCLFLFALTINIMDMNKVYCFPENNILTLHAIWHLICGYCIYLLVRYYCYQEKT